MYSQAELDAAVTAGALTPEAAQAFRDHVAASRATPLVDEEHFRLLTGFNDIFVSIAAILLLVAVGWIGGSIGGAFGGDGEGAVVTAGLGIAAVSWALSEYFTRQRRMALPSILLLLSFIGGVAFGLFGIVAMFDPTVDWSTGGLVVAVVALLTAGAAWLHWRRFMVPITIAVGASALVAMVVSLVLAALPTDLAISAASPVTLLAGLATFAFAMWWDMSDTKRQTRRSDVAFWLHLTAAPLIAHPVFKMMGVFGGDIGAVQAIIVLALYLVFAFVALAIDRRALLVSSLVYVLYALYSLFAKAGAVELGGALTALVIGSALLTLSAFWHPMRKMVVGTLGSLADRLPPVAVQPATASTQPSA